MVKKGLWANIHAKRKRGGKMRKPGQKGAPTAENFKEAAKKDSPYAVGFEPSQATVAGEIKGVLRPQTALTPGASEKPD